MFLEQANGGNHLRILRPPRGDRTPTRPRLVPYGCPMVFHGFLWVSFVILLFPVVLLWFSILGNSGRILQNNIKVSTGRTPSGRGAVEPWVKHSPPGDHPGNRLLVFFSQMFLAELGGPVRRDFVRFFGVEVVAD